MERVLTSGADLAVPPLTMVPARRGSCRSEAAPVAADGGVSRSWADLLGIGYHGGVAVVLAVAGFPAWRIGAVAAAAAVAQASVAVCRRRDVRRCVNADGEQIARFVVLNQWGLLASTALVVAVTGGIRSPLLVTLVAAYFASVAPLGDRRATRLLLIATAAAAGALAFAPAALAGPALGAAARGALTALGILGVGALLAPVHAQVRRKRDEIIRTRRELASDALARASALEQLGSKVAHELKNPLTGVKALVQLGLRNPAEAASHERLEVVEREVSRMQEVLQQYLSNSRPVQEEARRRVSLASVVSDTLVLLSGRADDAGVKLYADGDASVEADPGRLKDALVNLVVNAVEATPRGGEVVVEVRARGADVELVVRDTGRGMPPETLRRIGTPFFTTREDGTGLGVVLARTTVAQLGGTLRYESDEGAGTKVTVTLPRVADGELDAARAARG